MKALDKAIKGAKKRFFAGLIFVFILYIFSYVLYTYNKLEFSKEPLSLAFWVTTCFAIILSYYMAYHNYKLYDRVKKIDFKEYLLWFKYDNGDELILAKGMVIPYSKNVVKKTEITGASWGLDNIKNAIDDLKNGDIPFGLIIPSIQISSNKVPNIISLVHGGGYAMNLYYVDVKDFNMLLLIIHNGNSGREMILKYPISSEIKFNLNDFYKLLDDLNNYNMVLESDYIDEAKLKELKT